VREATGAGAAPVETRMTQNSDASIGTRRMTPGRRDRIDFLRLGDGPAVRAGYACLTRGRCWQLRKPHTSWIGDHSGGRRRLPGVLCSVRLLSDDGRHLVHSAAAELPISDFAPTTRMFVPVRARGTTLVATRFTGKPLAGFLQKPYRAADLLAALAHCVEED
jgi:hypothetical protein